MKMLLGLMVLGLFFNCKDNGSTESEAAVELARHGAVLVDVRTRAEFSQNHIQGSINIPHDQIGARIQEIVRDSNQPIVLYCLSGARSHIATQVLREMGYPAVVDGGGIKELSQALTK